MRFLALILLFGPVSCYSQSEKYSVVNQSKEAGDNVTNARYWIVRNQLGDSISLGSTWYRDWPAPKFFFINNDRVAYEWGNESKRTINVRDLISDKLLFSEEGVFSKIDNVNKVLFFFRKNELLALDLDRLESKTILVFESIDPIEFPELIVNSAKRTVDVNGISSKY